MNFATFSTRPTENVSTIHAWIQIVHIHMLTHINTSAASDSIYMAAENWRTKSKWILINNSCKQGSTTTAAEKKFAMRLHKICWLFHSLFFIFF